jgi:hypothetical protein
LFHNFKNMRAIAIQSLLNFLAIRLRFFTNHHHYQLHWDLIAVSFYFHSLTREERERKLSSITIISLYLKVHPFNSNRNWVGRETLLQSLSYAAVVLWIEQSSFANYYKHNSDVSGFYFYFSLSIVKNKNKNHNTCHSDLFRLIVRCIPFCILLHNLQFVIHRGLKMQNVSSLLRTNGNNENPAVLILYSSNCVWYMLACSARYIPSSSIHLHYYYDFSLFLCFIYISRSKITSRFSLKGLERAHRELHYYDSAVDNRY